MKPRLIAMAVYALGTACAIHAILAAPPPLDSIGIVGFIFCIGGLIAYYCVTSGSTK